jgi:hypothetical protein
MKCHDTREEYARIAKWLEANDVEIDWEELKKSPWWVAPADWVPPPKWSMPKPFPRPLTHQMVTNLLLAREKQGLEVPWWLTEGGEGVEPAQGAEVATGLTSRENFLQALSNLQITTVSLTLVTAEERRGLVRMAMIEEELSKRDRERNVERVMRQARGEVKEEVGHWGEKRLVRSASLGKVEAIEECERRGIVSEERIKRWREVAERKREQMRGIRKKRRVESIFWPGGEMKKKEEKEEVKEGVKEKGEVEMEVVRVGPNPRMLICRYFDETGEVKVGVRVKSIRTFKRGMKFRMVDKGREGELWEYNGKLPRLVGRW